MFVGEPLAAFLPPGHRLAARESITPGDLGDDVLIVTPREGDPTLHDHLTTLLATAGHRFFDVRETTGEDARSLLLAAAENQCVAIAPASTREIVGDIASLVNTRPLEPVLRTPDTALAWRVTPPPELEPIVAAARQAAADLYTRSSQDGSPPDR